MNDLNVLEEQIGQIITEHLDLVVINAKSLAESKERAARLLIVQSILATFLKTFEDDLSRAITMREAQYAQGISVSDGKNITEKKANIALYSEYTDARELSERLEAFKSYIKTHIKIFENAHLLFRQLGRE
jgi:hypothetical protein